VAVVLGMPLQMCLDEKFALMKDMIVECDGALRELERKCTIISLDLRVSAMMADANEEGSA
jgi:hypothetical protein